MVNNLKVEQAAGGRYAISCQACHALLTVCEGEREIPYAVGRAEVLKHRCGVPQTPQRSEIATSLGEWILETNEKGEVSLRCKECDDYVDRFFSGKDLAEALQTDKIRKHVCK